MQRHTSLLFFILGLCIINTSCAPDTSSQILTQSTQWIEPVATPESLQLPTSEGEMAEGKIWKPRTNPYKAGIVFVSGVDGGFVEPVNGIYERIATELSHTGVTSIFVQYRKPGELEPSIQDALAAIDHLKSLGVQRVALVGWSFGGAVITHSATRAPEVATVVGFAPQSRDTEAVQQFTKQSILLVHSDEDENVPFEASQQILDEAPTGIEKQLVDLKGFNHILDGAQGQVDPIVLDWLNKKLGIPVQASRTLNVLNATVIPHKDRLGLILRKH
ncbi:MAG: alpha/beta hydrolase family protein [Bdellovibrionia bacterium]